MDSNSSCSAELDQLDLPNSSESTLLADIYSSSQYVYFNIPLHLLFLKVF